MDFCVLHHFITEKVEIIGGKLGEYAGSISRRR